MPRPDLGGNQVELGISRLRLRDSLNLGWDGFYFSFLFLVQAIEPRSSHGTVGIHPITASYLKGALTNGPKSQRWLAVEEFLFQATIIGIYAR